MDQYQHIAEVVALTLGVSWASGINLYAAIAMLGVLGASGSYELPPGLELLENPLVIGAAGLMYVVEFFADKIPGVDTAWDGLHTFVRIPAGVLLAVGSAGELGPAAEFAAAILGGSLAAGTHATKAGSRVLINSSPEPFSNWGASVAEDAMVFGGLWVALQHPWLFLALLVAFVLFMIWLLPKIWHGIRRIFGWLREQLGGQPRPPARR